MQVRSRLITTSAGVAIVVPTSAPHTDAPRCSAGPSSQPAAIAAVFIESYPHKCPVPISEPRTMRQGEPRNRPPSPSARRISRAAVSGLPWYLGLCPARTPVRSRPSGPTRPASLWRRVLRRVNGEETP